jgi:SulP family sulfate permease
LSRTGYISRLRWGMSLHLPSISHLFAAFKPRLLEDLRSYNQPRFFKDLGAGATVGIVALPLAMAFAIASGLSPEAGLWTAIIGGFLVSVLGGSSVQIGGPAGAFIVIVYGIVDRYGLANLFISTLCAGVLLFMLGWFKLGTLVRYVPVSVVIGFTNGIAVLIALSQLRDVLGVQVDKMPADFFGQISTLARVLDTVNVWSVVLAATCVAGLFIWPRIWAHESGFRQKIDQIDRVSALKATSRVPAPVIALVSLTLLAWLLQLPVETIGSRFGGIPQSLPVFQWPSLSWETARMLVVPTLTIALLGAIESLLCARVADQLCDQPKHNPNQELMAQGVANAVVPFFGGMPVTGTIARTVTNIRAGATSPVAGIVHAITLAVVVLAAAPLAQHIPLSVLAGVLLFVAWNMGEWKEFARLKHFSSHYRLMLLSTFFVTIVFDLTVAVELGLVLAVVLFVRRQSDIFSVKETGRSSDTLTYRLSGALFFGAVAKIDPIIEMAETAPEPINIKLDGSQMVSLDTTGLDALEQLLRALQKRGAHLSMTGLHDQPRSLIERSGFRHQLHQCD